MPRSARRASGTPTSRRPREAASHSAAHPRSRARERDEAQRLPRHAGEVERRQDDAHRLAALAQGEGSGGERAGQRGQEERPARGWPRQQPRHTQPEQQVGAEKHLEEGHRGGLEGGEGQLASVARVLVARQGDDRAEDEPEGRDDRVRVGQREEDVPAQEVGPPVGLRVPGEDERDVREEERPGGDRDGEGWAAETGGDGAQGQDEAEGPEGHVEAGEGVPGVGAGPAQGRGSHEVGPEVVAEREAGDAGDLGRVADHQLAREPHVEGGVEGHQGIEEEVAGGVEAVAPVLGERKEGRHGEEGGKRTPEGRAPRHAASSRGGGGACPRPAP